MSFFRRPKPPAEPTIPADTVVYAVGDVHGRLDLLSKLIDWVRADFGRAGEGKAGVLIFLGDYVDRGADSKGVIERISTLVIPAVDVLALKGNHEQMLLNVLQDPTRGSAWARAGGLATLSSYGVDPPPRDPTPEDWVKTTEALAEAIPNAHMVFLEGLKTAAVVGGYFFVHAGIRPGKPLDEQTEADLLWIRDPFLKHKGSFEKLIVHGHSTATEPMIADYRIGIDTGAYATGILTCLRIDGEGRRLVGIGLDGIGLWGG